jgi:hypothetical protein
VGEIAGGIWGSVFVILSGQRWGDLPDRQPDLRRMSGARVCILGIGVNVQEKPELNRLCTGLSADMPSGSLCILVFDRISSEEKRGNIIF